MKRAIKIMFIIALVLHIACIAGYVIEKKYSAAIGWYASAGWMILYMIQYLKSQPKK